MLNCKEVTRLLSEGQDRPLGLAEKMQLEMHLAICQGCRNFRSQLAFLRDACRRYLGGHDDGD
ncbi:MAG TPA: zf-HC2 domain-containing protein [Azonexus sp.]